MNKSAQGGSGNSRVHFSNFRCFFEPTGEVRAPKGGEFYYEKYSTFSQAPASTSRAIARKVDYPTNEEVFYE